MLENCPLLPYNRREISPGKVYPKAYLCRPPAYRVCRAPQSMSYNKQTTLRSHHHVNADHIVRVPRNLNPYANSASLDEHLFETWFA